MWGSDQKIHRGNQGKRKGYFSEFCVCCCMHACSVMSDSLQPHGVGPTKLLCSWNSPGKNTGVGCHFILQGIFPTEGLNPCLLGLLHWQADSLPLCHLVSHSSKFIQIQLSVSFQFLVIRMFFSSCYRKGTFLVGDFMACFSGEKERSESPSCTCFF